MGFTIVRTPRPVYVSTEDEAERWLSFFWPKQEIGVDTETTGLDKIRDRVRFFSLGVKDARICGPVRLLPAFADLLERDWDEKRLSNANYDKHLIANHGIRLQGHILDTVDMDFCIDENRQGRHGLKACALDYLGLRMTPFKEVFGNAGSTDNEVRTLCEIHDLLELHDVDGKVKKAQEWAKDILLRLRRVEGDPEVIAAVQKLHLSLRAVQCTRTAKQVMSIAEDFGVVPLHSGVHRHASEFVGLLGGTPSEEWPARDRKALLSLLEDDRALREVTEIVYEALLAKTGVPANPVEFLREQAADYASLDAWASHALVPVLRARLGQEDMQMITEDVLDHGAVPDILLCHYDEVRVRFGQILWNVERRGMPIDVETTGKYAVDMQKEIDRIGRDIVKETGDVQFNPGSPDQLRDRLFTQDREGQWYDPFGDAPKKMTKGGASGIKEPSTDKEALEEFAGKGNELCRLILEYRQFKKLHGDYMVGLPQWIDRNHRIHTSLNAGGARTWRLSSQDPNLQNIPAKGKWGKLIRKLFIAGLWGDVASDICLPHLLDVPVPNLPPDFPMRLIVSDYKQLEMCILAHFSRDPNMIETIRTGQDIHCKTVMLASDLGAAGLPKGITYEQAKAAKKAADIEGRILTAIEEMLVEKRSQLKSTGFGIVYGIGAVKLGMQLGLKIVKIKGRDACPEAQALINAYLYDIFPGVGEFIERTQEECKEDLIVYTLRGHPRRLPEIDSTERGLAAQARRQAPNARVQGSAVDICNEAMDKCERDEVLRSLGARMLMQIHDELIFEVPDDPEFYVPAEHRIKTLMENPFPMRVPILVDAHNGYSWGDCK